ncbi:unnamed protein product [Eruca vesicaria subsp. sativa]|uniref:GRF-type domain-containing protein n=1 Tax=Eruca vesicaria subsp. sativa TaxID=29727 RepID=A0ABC8IZE8_ERUVS|nr:unnamed protein product [Eruca vesicaria subsp. sativa]
MADRGFPTHCPCGSRVSRRTSKTPTNPGRLFHSCPYGNENNPHHLFKWTDLCMVEEIEDIKFNIDGLQMASVDTEKVVQVCQSQIENLTLENRACCSLVSTLKNEISGFEQEIKDAHMELRSLKNMVACVVVLFVVYKLCT